MSEPTKLVVPMPHMGVSVEEGTVIEWLKAVGEEVAAEEPICAIATDKVDTEVVAPADGVLAKILAEPGTDVPVGEPLAELAVGDAAAAVALEAAKPVGEGSPDAAQRSVVAAGAAEDSGASGSVSGDPSPTGLSDSGARSTLAAHSAVKLSHGPRLAERAAAGRDAFGRFDPKAAAEAVLSLLDRAPAASAGSVPASPVARRMATRHGIDLAAVQGSGRNGRIRKTDVEAAIAAGGAPMSSAAATGAPAVKAPSHTPTQPPSTARPEPSPLDPSQLPPGYAAIPHEVVPASRIRKLIAEHMVRSRRTAAHMTTEVDVDLSTAVAARAELNAARAAAGEPKLSYLPFIARAACAAIADHPEVNASFLGDRIVHWQAVNLGVAVDTDEGLLVPVIKGCEQLTAPSIGAAIADLAERARSRRLAPDDLAGGTFTLSNPGSVGAVSAPAIINQPQVAILGVPTIQRRPWVIADAQGNGAIAIRPILRLAVTFDHRALDGANATRFAVAVKDRLEAWGPAAYT
jgi:2-oxoglutarate dehydrogenase E2 component (dihydrolipoamide succinyltransferase)